MRFATANEMAVGFVVMTSPVLVVWFGAHLIMQGELTVGQLTQFLLYLAMFYAPIQRLSDLGRVLATSVASMAGIDSRLAANSRCSARRLVQCRGDCASRRAVADKRLAR